MNKTNYNNIKNELPDIFEKVKKDVNDVFGQHRAGLNLGLADLGVIRGSFIGGMHFYPGNEIVMNKTPLKLLIKQHPYDIIWAYTYHILLHEYLHSLGILNEQRCRRATLEVTKEIFKDEDHPAHVMAKKGIGAYFSDLEFIYAPPNRRPDGISVEYVKGFDRNSYSYYS
jgi:hypothetical protein